MMCADITRPLCVLQPTISHRRLVRTSARKTTSETSFSPRVVDVESFEAYGQIISSQEDGARFSIEREAKLDLAEGVPRLYMMRLRNKGGRLQFDEMNYHGLSSQSLSSVSELDWFIAVSRATFSEEQFPSHDDIEVFRIPGHVAINLNKGTWHAGPLFSEDERDFLNLELMDTNTKDRYGHKYEDSGTRFTIEL